MNKLPAGVGLAAKEFDGLEAKQMPGADPPATLARSACVPGAERHTRDGYAPRNLRRRRDPISVDKS